MTTRRAPVAARSVSLALAATTAAASLSFSRVFRGGSFAPTVLGAAVLPHVIGGLARARRSTSVPTLLASAAGLLLWAVWTTAPRSTTYGVPGPATLHQLARNLDRGWGVYRTGHAPIPATAGIVLLCVILTWLVAVAGDELAFRRGASLGAVVPALLLFVVGTTVGTTGLRTPTTLGFAAAAMTFLLVQHESLLEARRAWFTGRRLGPSSGFGAGAAAGLAAIVAGLVLAPALPGARAGPLLNYRSLGGGTHAGGGYDAAVNPLVDLRSRLTTQQDAELFTVQANRRLYWRLVALDQFDGQTWTLHSRGETAATGLRLTGATGPTVRQRFSIETLGDRWLPATYEPVSVSLRGVEVVPESRTLIAAQDSVVALDYTVRSRVARAPSLAEITATAAPVPARMRRFTGLPVGFPADVAALAHAITDAEPTLYGKAEALERFFTTAGGFQYDLSVPPSGRDPLREFLFGARRGFCQQFAATYAAMARAVGLPARVAVGFTPGTYDPGITAFRVTGRDAHAWAEVWLPGLGWTAMEPTPAGSAPGQADPTAGGTPTSGPVAEGPAVPSTAVPPTSPAVRATTPPPRAPASGDISVAPAPAPAPHAASATAAWVLLAVVGSGAVILALVHVLAVAWRRARRRARRRAVAEPRDAIVAAWEEALDRLDEAGRPRRPALTPAEVARATSREQEFAATARALGALARDVTIAAWSTYQPVAADARGAWEELDALVDALKHSIPARTRARRLLLPSESGFTAAARTQSRV